MTREEFEKSFNIRLSDLKESIVNEDNLGMQSYYRGKCVGMIVLALDLGIIDNTTYSGFSNKIFNA